VTYGTRLHGRVGWELRVTDQLSIKSREMFTLPDETIVVLNITLNSTYDISASVSRLKFWCRSALVCFHVTSLIFASRLT